MQIQINTDNTMASHAPLNAHVESVVNGTLHRVSVRISRVEVHLSTVNDHKHSGGEHRCMMEARMEGHPPIAVNEHASTLHQAIQGAADKLKRAIESALGRIDDVANAGDPSPDTEIEPLPE
jgi:ribosome-associated translation inhibitor RaiA